MIAAGMNSAGQPIMPNAVDPITGQPRMFVGRRNRGYFVPLPQPPPSAPGRIIISLVPNIANPEAGSWTPQLDGNMDFVLRGNDTWVTAAILTSLMTDISQIQFGPHPFAEGATSAKKCFVFMALCMLAWFFLSAWLMQNGFAHGGMNM